MTVNDSTVVQTPQQAAPKKTPGQDLLDHFAAVVDPFDSHASVLLGMVEGSSALVRQSVTDETLDTEATLQLMLRIRSLLAIATMNSDAIIQNLQAALAEEGEGDGEPEAAPAVVDNGQAEIRGSTGVQGPSGPQVESEGEGEEGQRDDG